MTLLSSGGQSSGGGGGRHKGTMSAKDWKRLKQMRTRRWAILVYVFGSLLFMGGILAHMVTRADDANDNDDDDDEHKHSSTYMIRNRSIVLVGIFSVLQFWFATL